jgi:hypothetical protein
MHTGRVKRFVEQALVSERILTRNDLKEIEVVKARPLLQPGQSWLETSIVVRNRS